MASPNSFYHNRKMYELVFVISKKRWVGNREGWGRPSLWGVVIWKAVGLPLLWDPKVPLVGTHPTTVLPNLFVVKDQILFVLISIVSQADTFVNYNEND